MTTKKMPISQFVAQLEAALKRKDGYIMGAKGQNPQKWSKTSWWFTQYSGSQKNKALYWRDNASRVWDCNGMAEGIYEDWSGVNINTKARYNYSGWCDPKGTGNIPTKYRVPGAAVFIYSKSSGYITHVGYLYKPVTEGKTSGDWWVIEARGVMHGVVKTKLSERGWNRWGLMTKYFDYNNSEMSSTVKHLGDELLENGDEGVAVKELQTALIRLGYDCGKWGADGDFGDATELALRDFQKDHNTKADGIYGPNTHAAMEKALVELDKPAEEEPHKVKIVGGQCWVRTGYNTKCDKLGVAKEGSVWAYGGVTADNGWHLINYENQNGWVSGTYGKLIDE